MLYHVPDFFWVNLIATMYEKVPHRYDNFPICVWMGILEIQTEHVRGFADNLNVLDYCKIQDAIFLKILSFHSI